MSHRQHTVSPTAPRVERVLKRDALGRVELVTEQAGLVVHRVPTRVPVIGTVARLLVRRERRALAALPELPRVPRVLDRPGVGWRSWLPGQPLSTAPCLPRDFFDHLEDLVRAMHARGVCHNDLHKEGNILVGDDGLPALIDFQIASVHRRCGRTFAVRAAEDLRQVRKHRAVYCRALGEPEPDAPSAPRRSLAARAWRRLWKPFYNFLMRATGLRRRLPSGEPRRRRDGTWPTWIAAIGPRPLPPAVQSGGHATI